MKTKKNFVITKKKHTYTISDKKSGKSLYHIVDVPVYDNFSIDRPLLSGLGSVMNVPGNYYSFEKYLKNKTYVIVTHRPKLKELCNKHYVFENHMMKELIVI